MVSPDLFGGMQMTIGHSIVGSGKEGVFAWHGWFGDHTVFRLTDAPFFGHGNIYLFFCRLSWLWTFAKHGRRVHDLRDRPGRWYKPSPSHS